MHVSSSSSCWASIPCCSTAQALRVAGGGVPESDQVVRAGFLTSPRCCRPTPSAMPSSNASAKR